MPVFVLGSMVEVCVCFDAMIRSGSELRWATAMEDGGLGLGVASR